MIDDTSEAERMAVMAQAEQHLLTALDLLTGVMPICVAYAIVEQICEDHATRTATVSQAPASTARH